MFFKNTRLYYDYRTGIYYKYNQEKGTYEFYSQIAVSSDSVTTNSQASSESVSKRTNESSNSKTRERSGSEKREIKKIDLVESGSEDGEIVEVDDVDKGTQGRLYPTDLTNTLKHAFKGKVP